MTRSQFFVFFLSFRLEQTPPARRFSRCLSLLFLSDCPLGRVSRRNIGGCVFWTDGRAFVPSGSCQDPHCRPGRRIPGSMRAAPHPARRAVICLARVNAV